MNERKERYDDDDEEDVNHNDDDDDVNNDDDDSDDNDYDNVEVVGCDSGGNQFDSCQLFLMGH